MRYEPSAQFVAASVPARIARGYGPDADELVQAHRGLVRKIAWHVHGRTQARSDIDDLIQIGLMALVEAARSYEDRGHNFSTYASVRIRGAMIDQLRRDMPFRRSSLVAARRIEAARDQLEQQWHRKPSNSEVAAALELEPAEFLALEQSAVLGATLSIDDDEAGIDLLANLVQPGADVAAEQNDLAAALAAALTELAPREQMVLQLYFHEELNLAEIGAVMDVTPARVCQIKANALAKLAEVMREQT